MKNQKVDFIICIVALCVFPSLLYAQTSYEDKLKQKLDDPLKVIEENKRLVGGKDDWFFYRGKWEAVGETIKYIGTDPSIKYGAALHKTQRLWNGYIETSITFTEAFLRNKDNSLYIMLSYNPVTGDRYSIGFGGQRSDEKLAYSFWDTEIDEDGDYDEDDLAYSGMWEDLLADFEYKIRIVVRERQADFIVNGVKVFTSKLPRNMYSDFVGIVVHGTSLVEFKYFHIKAEDPFEIIQKLKRTFGFFHTTCGK